MAEKMPPPGADVHKFSSTQVDLPPEIAQHLVAFGKTIPDKDLSPEEGASYGGSSSADGRETEAHVTVKYGIHGVSAKPVIESLAGEPPVRLKLGKTALFKSPEQEVLIVQIDSPDLHRLNGIIEKSGPFTDTHPGYKPHATIAYLKPGAGKKYEGLDKFAGMEATIPSVTFSAKDGSKTEIPLDGGDEMPKKMKFERQMARDARKMPPPGQLGPGDDGSIPKESIPHEALTDPLAATGSSGDLPPDAGPAKPTAPEPPKGADPNASPMPGNPPSPGVRKSLADLIRKSPDYRIAGQVAGKETFNQFRVRALSAVRGVMQALAQNPVQAIAVPKHSQISKLVQAWIAKGMPDDLSVDHRTMIADMPAKPGDVEKFEPAADGSWSLTKFDPNTEASLPGGAIYFVEHGETPITAAKSMLMSASQKARAKIVTAIQDGDWKAALGAARAANSAQVLSDEEISEVIDEAIPGPEEAEGLDSHHLLSAASAASPAKRAELMPVVQKRFGNLSGISPDAAQALQAHLGRIA